MLKGDIDKLNNKRLFLLKHLELSEELYQFLKNDKDRILTEDLETEIKEKSAGSRVGFFLDAISKRGVNAFETFLNALYHTGQSYVLFELEPRFSAKREATKSLNINLRSDDLKMSEMMTRITFPAAIHKTERLSVQEIAYQNLNHHISNAEIQEEKNKTNKSKNSISLNIDEITNTIKRKIECHEDGEADEDDIESSHSQNLGKVFTLKTKSDFIGGHDFLYLGHLDRKLGNNTSYISNLVRESSDLTINLERISKIVQRDSMICPMIFLDSECEGHSLLFKNGCKLPCSEAILQMLDLIKADTLVIMLSLYGKLNIELHKLSNIENCKTNNSKFIFISHLEKRGDNNHWMLCAMDECFMRINNSKNWNIRDVCSLLAKVGNRSKECNIISGFHFIKLPNSC